MDIFEKLGFTDLNHREDIELKVFKAFEEIKTMKTRWRLHQDEDGDILLENVRTGELQYIDMGESIIELKSNSRVGIKMINLDGNSCREEFN